jgi:hypothetical protein
MFSNILPTIFCHGGTPRRQIRGSESSSFVPTCKDTPSSSSLLVLPKIKVIHLTEDAEYEYMYSAPVDLCCDVSVFAVYSDILVIV